MRETDESGREELSLPPAVAIIPARGGSKRLPRKNIRQFLGVPAIQQVVSTAISSGVFSRVVVSTDDAEIGSVARAAGAETPFVRSRELSDDQVSTSTVIADVVKRLQSADQKLPDSVCCIYPTSVLLTSEVVVRSYRAFIDSGCDYLMVLQRYAQPVQRALLVTAGGVVRPMDESQFQRRTQDLPVAFYDAGQLYWGTAPAWMTSGGIFSGTVAAYEVDRLAAVDIDNESDWKFAEMIARYREEA